MQCCRGLRRSLQNLWSDSPCYNTTSNKTEKASVHTAKWHLVCPCTNNARIYTNTFQKISGFKASSAQYQACFSRTLLYETLLFVSLLVKTEHLLPWQPHLLFRLWLTAVQRGRGPAEDTPSASHCSPWRRNTMWFSTSTGVRIILFTF